MLAATLRSERPDAIVLRSRANKRFRTSIRAFEHGAVPRLDSPLAIVSTTEGGLAFHSETSAPFLVLPWSMIAGLRVRSYGDYLVPDLVTADGGYISHVLWIAVGHHALEVTLYGDEETDGNTAELDDYGIKVVIGRLERLKRRGRSSSHPQ